MAGTRKTHADGDMLRAAYDSLGDCSITHGVSVGYVLLPTRRRGVFLVRVRASRTTPNGSKEQISQVEREYPSAMVEGLGACLFNLAFQLDQRVGEALSVRALSEAQP